MHNSAWIALLRLVPTKLHNNLMIVTRIGQEVAVQNIFRMESDFVVLRGRLSGSNDEGRVFMLPYDEMHLVGFQKPMKEHEVTAIFTGQDPTAAAEQRAVEARDLAGVPTAEAPPPEPEPPPAPKTPAPAAPVEGKPKPGSKVLLLERVRARLAAANQARTAGTT
jgi:hypothetical protein